MEFPVALLLIFIRIAGVVFTAPILGSRCVPFRFRLLVAALISVAALPLVAPSTESILQPGEIFTAVTSEMVIGVMLGLGVAIMFAAAQAAGSVIANS